MTIRYRAIGEPKDKTVTVSSFEEFRSWLHDIGCGKEVLDPEVLEDWIGVYRRLGRPGFKPVSIARTRKPTTPWTIIIYGADIED